LSLFLSFFSSRRRHTRSKRDWSSDVCSSDLVLFSLVGFFSDVFGCYGIFSRLGWLLIGCSVSSYALGFTNNGLLWRDRFHNQFDNRHWGVVAGTVTDLCDTGIPAFTVCHGWANNSEQFVHNRFVGA